MAENETPSRARVLVAEDNAVNQRLAARMLEKRGCRVDVVANGLEAVEAVTRLAYDCVFIDCQMPEMDGYVAASMIRQREALTGAHIPIIAMTANAMEGDRERCFAAGMDDHISKPVEPHALAAAIQKWGQPAAGNPPGGASRPVTVTRSGAAPTGITGNCGTSLIDHYLFGAKLDTPWDPRL
jgi:CheY-like chemotaxis protein